MFKVAIVGRTNVGKSSLFNRLTKTRRALVADEPGLTRDRLYGRVDWQGRRFELIDTGGLLLGEEELIPKLVLEQVARAVEEADLVLLVVDGRHGLHPLDEEIARFLRRQEKPVLLVVNKIDSPKLLPDAAAFYALGWEELFPVSAEHGLGIGELLDRVAAYGNEVPSQEAERREIKVAIIGRPNVGKSLLLNRLAREERAIVSELPGTTRDAVDTLVRREGKLWRIVDTAGIRRKGKTEALAEKLSVISARKALERADVAFLVLDAVEGPTKLDAAIGGYAHRSGCSVIIVLNKWDMIEDKKEAMPRLEAAVRRRMKFLDYAPVVTTSALLGLRIDRLFREAERAAEARSRRIPTSTLNRFFQQEIKSQIESAGRPKFEVKYLTQVAVAPPLFVLFISGRDTLHFSLKRFIENRIRSRFGFYATPLRIVQRTG